jgi:hypothetical protein
MWKSTSNRIFPFCFQEKLLVRGGAVEEIGVGTEKICFWNQYPQRGGSAAALVQSQLTQGV